MAREEGYSPVGTGRENALVEEEGHPPDCTPAGTGWEVDPVAIAREADFVPIVRDIGPVAVAQGMGPASH